VNRDARIFVAGSDTLAGAALLELLGERGFSAVVRAEDGPDLDDALAVEAFFREVRPEFVFLVGGRSGGIGLNRDCPAELMIHNLRVATNVIDAARRHCAAKLLYAMSSCAYPREAPQPLRPESLGTGPLEPTSEAYATAKYAGWKLCDAYRRQYGARFVTVVPTNAFGPHDDFGPESGHVIPALIRRAHAAKMNREPTLTVWGSGTPQREFLYSRDLADALLFAMRTYDADRPLNLGGGDVVSIGAAAQTVAAAVGFRGRLVFDVSKPDGAPLKALDASELFALGWRPTHSFAAAVGKTYRWFLQHGVTEDATHARAAL
jgi:GDP-L-fucose synthase